MDYKLEYGVITDRGKKREINEDSFLIIPKERVFMVADGMGGHYGGEIASNLTVDLFKTAFTKAVPTIKETAHKENIALMDRIIQRVNIEIRKKAAASDVYNDMGTTTAGIIFLNDSAMTFHVGDSRVYLFREGELFQVTNDHSWINEQLRTNKMSTNEARSHKWKNVIMRALGSAEQVIPEYSNFIFAKDDVYILCSDGLYDMVPDKGIARVLARYGEPQEMANVLLEEALKKGGLDNVTIIAVKVV